MGGYSVQHRRSKRSGSSRGSVSIAHIIGLVVVIIFVSAILWVARIVLVELELQNTVNAAATAVSATGCWDTQAQQAWTHGTKLWPLALAGSTLKLDSTTTQSYQSYGHVITVAASLPITLWGTVGSPGGSLTLRATRQEFSTAPTLQTTSCSTLP